MKILKRLFLGLLIIVAVLVIFVFVRSNRTWDPPYPENNQASKDSTIIARGQYLAYGPAHCADCHGDPNQREAFAKGATIPLSGGLAIEFPPATIHVPNITPDDETGVGKVTDKQLARSLRQMVGHKGNLIFPMMPFQDLSEDDLNALLSFIRSQQPVSNKVAPTEYTFLGKALVAFGLLKPEAGKPNPPQSVVKEPTAAYGKYLAYSVANCVGCHTERDLKTGAFIGEDMAGGLIFGPDNLTQNFVFVSPNLTPDAATGYITNWSEEQFIARMKKGRVHATSPMPWEAFGNIDTTDLKALYAFIRSVKPVNKKVAKNFYAPGEEVPGL